MTYYYNVLKRKIERKTATKEKVTMNVALWQAYGLISDDEFMLLMELIETTYPAEVEEVETEVEGETEE